MKRPGSWLEADSHDPVAPVNHRPFDDTGLGHHQRHRAGVVTGGVLCGNAQLAPGGALPVE